MVDSPFRAQWGGRIDHRPDAAEVYSALDAAASLSERVEGTVCPHVHFLLDECVSPLLEPVAYVFGYAATFIHHRGWGELKDEQLRHRVIDQAFTLVTNNRDDWLHHLGGSALHPGLVVIRENAPRARQIAFFAQCMLAMTALSSMVNMVVEVDASGAVDVYARPVE